MEISQLEKEFQQKMKQFLDDAEKNNIHPDKLPKLPCLPLFKSFSKLNTTPQYEDISFFEDEKFQVLSNKEDYYEKGMLDEVIKKWFEGNDKVYPQNNLNTELFYDYNISPILEAKKNPFCRETYDYHIIKSRIYVYRTNEKQNESMFNSLKPIFTRDFESYDEQRNSLNEELKFSSRVDGIFVDPKNMPVVFKINGNDTFKFTNIFFWDFYDAYLLLQKTQPSLFGSKNTNIILRALHEIFIKKNANYWNDYEEFKLKITQQFYYIADSEKKLRLDLFRNELKDGSFEGGLWHSFNHFKQNGKALSSINKGGIEYSEPLFFNMLKDAFFVSEWKWSEPKDGEKGGWVTEIPCLAEKGTYKFVFHENKCYDYKGNTHTIYYLNTVIYQS